MTGVLPVLTAIRPWADPGVVQLNRLAAHVPLTGFTRRSLDGEWSLTMFDRPDDVPAAAVGAAAAAAAVNVGGDGRGAESGSALATVTVEVPGNWTMQDLGSFIDPPQYLNIAMPFPGPPPELPDHNPTGVYRRPVELPAGWLRGRKRVVLGIDGAESVHAVYLNGTFVGYGTDSRLPSEYDITAMAQPGVNDLAVVVVKFSAQSYVEDQDQWWMGGLHRSVWVESRPAVHLADIPVDTDFDPEAATGTIRSRPRIDFGPQPEPGWTVRTSVLSPTGKSAGRVDEQPVPHHHHDPYGFTGFVVTADIAIRRAKPWSAERPDRYTVITELVSPRGKVVQTERHQVGLTRIEVADRRLLVNGEAVWIFGVNRHDHHPVRGKAVTVDDMRADLEAMRQLNITAIRTSHYPNDHRFLDLCDELGFYVVDEANIESHAYNRSLADVAAYRPTWLERGSRMIERDRNHPSIILWSLGNESGYGDNHRALAGWIRGADPSRPLHYEDAIRIEGWDNGGREGTDVVCPMYPTHAAIEAYGWGDGDRPLIMCEYSHAMGNSAGGLADYWDLITSVPGLQGGFLWEWKDHGLVLTMPDGSERLAYGGMFGDQPNDANFVADGLMAADLTPHPAAHELAWVHRPVTVSAAGSDADGLVVENRRSFVDLRDLRAEWEFTADDGSVRRGRLAVPRLDPHESTVVALPAPVAKVLFGGGAGWLTVRWFTRSDDWFADAGHLVAWDQVVIGTPVLDHRDLPDDTDPVDPETLGVTEPTLELWRAPVDNDGFKLTPDLSRRLNVGGDSMVRWEDNGVASLPADELVSHQFEVIDCGADSADGADAGGGELDDDIGTLYRHVVEVPKALADPARVGVAFEVPARFDTVRWFGRGPHENYPDRNRSAVIGLWEQPVDDQPYLVPQEYGLRTECRWLDLVDTEAGETIRIEVEEPEFLHASVNRFSADELFDADHADDLVPGDRLVVHLDAAHRGVGTASCGPDILPEYEVAAGHYEFAYRIAAFRHATDDA